MQNSFFLGLDEMVGTLCSRYLDRVSVCALDKVFDLSVCLNYKTVNLFYVQL